MASVPVHIPREEFKDGQYRLLRALEQKRALESEIENWIDGRHYELVTRRDPESRQRTVHFRFGGFPPEWGPRIGEVLQGLRIALDNIVYGMAAACGPLTQSEAVKIAFPIFGPEPLGPERAQEMMRNVPLPVQDVIRSMQPHLHGYATQVLWVLDRMADIDKQRAPRLVPIHTTAMQAHPPPGSEALPVKRLYFHMIAGDTFRDLAKLAWYDPVDGVEDDVEIELTLDVAFQERVCLNHRVRGTLDQCGLVATDVVRRIIAAYDAVRPPASF
jgi:hypothetical protein